uniref:Uncharacterized protein n=1 Tax=Moniliophthora roreri TaxID=221103 RepID=A0A0W0FX06_MONRR
MSANDYYNQGQDKGYYPPQGPPPGQGGYYPQQPQQAYGGYGQPPPQQGGYYPQQGGYQPQPQPQTVIMRVLRILDAWPVWLVYCAVAALKKFAIAFSKQSTLNPFARTHSYNWSLILSASDGRTVQ